MELLTKETGLEKLTGQRITTNELLSFIDKAFLDLETNFNPHNFPEEQGKFVELMLCICCQKVFAESPIDDFGEAVEWNVGDRGENCLDHQTEKLIIDYSHFSSDGEAEKVYITEIFLATGQNSGQIFSIKRSRTGLDAPAEYEIIAKGEQAVNGYNAPVLKLCQNLRNDF